MSEKSKMDVENEFGLMGCILHEPEVWLPMTLNKGAVDGWFRHAGVRSVWMAVNALKVKGKPVDPITAMEQWRMLWDKQENGETQKGAAKVSEPDVGLLERIIESVSVSSHAEYYCDLVRERWIADSARSLGREFSNTVGHGAQDAIMQMSAKLQDLMDQATKGGTRYSLENVVADIKADVRQAFQVVMVEGHGKVRYSPGLAFPWHHMNNMYGSALPGIHIISGRPSTGKTTLVNNFLRYWCEVLKAPGGIDSMDMTPKMFMMRNVSEICGVSLPKALRGNISRDQLDKWNAAVDIVGTWNVEPNRIYDIDEFRSWVTVGVRKKGWKFVIVDFIQRMKMKNGWKMSENDRIACYTAEIKSLAEDLGIPIFALSQLSRDSEKDQRKPTMSDLRGGGSLEQDAKTILMLYRDPKVSEMWKDSAPVHLAAFSDKHDVNKYMASKLRPVFACLEKNQDGETGDIPLVMYPSYFRFRMADYLADTCIEYAPNSDKVKSRHEAAKFGRVHPDWRNFPHDAMFAKAKGLVTEYEDGVE